MQCNKCVYSKRNTGVLVEESKQPFFCRRLDKVRDEVVRELLEPLLLRLSSASDCPHFDGGHEGPDSYVADDRWDREQEGEAQ